MSVQRLLDRVRASRQARAAMADYSFAPHEQPTFPGSPYNPAHATWRRVVYGLVAVVMALTMTFGYALVTINIQALAGGLDIYVADAGWLTAAYVGTNACANLLLVKARQQFGIPAVSHTLLVVYAAATVFQVLVPGFGSALMVRAVDGMTAAALSTLTLYYLIQMVPAKFRPIALLLGVTLPQFGSPLARMVPVEMLVAGNWHGLHLIELGLALAALAAMWAAPLPPSQQHKAFEKLDLVTVALFLPAMWLICGVLASARLLWWTDTPWLGWALMAAVPLVVGVLLIELNRKNPLIDLHWITSRDMARFAIVAFLMRLILSEQSVGAIGLITAAGLNNDQTHALFGVIIAAMVAGAVTAVLTVSAKSPPYQVMAAALIVTLAAWMDSDATALTRPAQLMVTQAMVGYATMLFIGPCLLYGFMRLLERGATVLVSLVVLFNLTQNLGGLLGAALFGTYQVARTRVHALAMSEHLLGSDPLVAARLAQGPAALSAAVTQQATIMGYNDMFRVIALLGVVTFCVILFFRLSNRARLKRAALGPTP